MKSLAKGGLALLIIGCCFFGCDKKDGPLAQSPSDTAKVVLTPPRRLIAYEKPGNAYLYIHHHPGVTKQELGSADFEEIANDYVLVVVYNLDGAADWEQLYGVPGLDYMKNTGTQTYEVVIGSREKDDLRIFQQRAWHPLYDVLFIEENPFPRALPNKDIPGHYKFILHAHSIDSNGYLHFSLESKTRPGFFLSVDGAFAYTNALIFKEVGQGGTPPTFILVDLD